VRKRSIKANACINVHGGILTQWGLAHTALPAGTLIQYFCKISGFSLAAHKSPGELCQMSIPRTMRKAETDWLDVGCSPNITFSSSPGETQVLPGMRTADTDLGFPWNIWKKFFQ
jgi:hypothetical protein